MSVPKTMPCDQRERWRNAALYGNQRNRNTPQRVYCRDCMSKSGPNISPPNTVAAVAAALSVRLPVNPHAAANVGAASARVTRSCVFPEGIKISCQESEVRGQNKRHRPFLKSDS